MGAWSFIASVVLAFVALIVHPVLSTVGSVFIVWITFSTAALLWCLAVMVLLMISSSRNRKRVLRHGQKFMVLLSIWGLLGLQVYALKSKPPSLGLLPEYRMNSPVGGTLSPVVPANCFDAKMIVTTQPQNLAVASGLDIVMMYMSTQQVHLEVLLICHAHSPFPILVIDETVLHVM